MKQRRRLGAIIGRAVTVQTLFVTGIVLIGMAGLLFERSVAATERGNERVLLDLSSFEFQVLNAETGFRGYALAQQDAFLQPYREAFPAIAKLRPRLLRTVKPADRPYMHEAFRVIADWRRNYAEPTLADFRHRNPEAARILIGTGVGKRRIDRIRLLVDRIRANQNAALQSASDKRRAISAALLGFVVLALLGGIAGGMRAASVLRRAVVNPMSRLADIAQRLAAGELDARTKPRGALEVAAVGESFNHMAGEVQAVVEGLREVDDLKTQFLSTVSHELRTPLTSINGYLQLLDQGVVGELTEDQRNYVHVAQRNSERLAALIDDLLMLSRFDAGREDLASDPVDIAQQLRNLCEEMQPVADRARTRLSLDTPAELVVPGDARRLSQTFANLVSNAIKFNRAGGAVDMSAAAVNGEVLVEVSDEGVGIPPAELDRIGERFFRASTTTNMPGTGLGLAITREIVERHGGTLEIESEVGKGSTFRIRLPR